MRIISEKDYEHIFPTRNKIYTYESFLKAVGAFPAFCGESLKVF